MFSHVKRKICSQRGASLSMALMLFLVCTTVASIVLAAGSAAIGRVSQLKEMEKSYCNVSSAAELIWDELNQGRDGAEVHIVRTCESLDDSLTPGEHTTYTFTVDGEEKPSTLFQKIACDLVFGTSTTLVSTSYTISDSTIKSSLTNEHGDLEPRLLGLDSVSASKKEYDALTAHSSDERLEDVTVKIVREEDGDLVFSFSDDGFQSFHATITAKLGVDDLAPRVTRGLDGTYRAEYETILTWDGESIRVGGDSS
ncbi:MAG: hypothetical protein J6S63_08825 [Atopobiaceae bacterium]|nr:hypothetical protein [Atopobiaceae bacterium]